jgi:hypothetical protein
MANLLESYAKRIAISEGVYAKQHSGAKMSNHKKLAVARVLENTQKFMNEAFTNTVGTQRSDMGEFKKFCLNLTTVALPNLIANDLVIVSPMSSMTGYITYVEYGAATTKGDVSVMGIDENGETTGSVFNSPFGLGKVHPDYTSNRIVEAAEAGTLDFAWTPIEGTVKVKVSGVWSEDALKPVDGVYTAPEGTTNVSYEYDNIVVPQDTIPSIKAQMKSIPLLAKARRIAVYYSQIAAFQAKTDYGFDLGDQLAEKAVGQLSYEIDTEVVNLLDKTAGEGATLVFKGKTTADDQYLSWDRTLPVGVSKSEHYEGFSEVIEVGRQVIYDRTKRFAPNYMIIASNILPILTFMKGFKAAPAGQINGPYFAGTLNGLKVFVSPAIKAGRFLLGVNGDDMMSSVAVYAPYMAIVPTQLLQYADGGTSQGWSTMYDLKVLNDNLIVAGEVTGKIFQDRYNDKAGV